MNRLGQYVRLGLVLAAGVLPLYAASDTQDFVRSSGWVFGDFNGDQRPDVALSRAGRGDARGFRQQVRILFGVSGETSFEFHSRTAHVQLGARDVDGDHDRDIVIEEPLTRVPIGIWINDGDGSFHEGDLASFGSAFRGRGPASFERPGARYDSFPEISEQSSPSVLPVASSVYREKRGAAVCVVDHARPLEPTPWGRRSRAPPFFA